MADRPGAGLQSAYKDTMGAGPGAKMGHEVGMADFNPAADSAFAQGSSPSDIRGLPLSRTESALRAILLVSFGAVLALEAYLIWQVVLLVR